MSNNLSEEFLVSTDLTCGKTPKVLVGMSGGVDSSVAAALLVEQGFDVTGAYMKNWTLDIPGMQCPWAEDLAYAKRTAVKLGIDFRVYDFQEEYKRDVVDYLVAEYKAGRTPNPDIMCNQQVKFGAFLDAALADGFDYIATGHYARRFAASLGTEASRMSCVAPRFAVQDSANPSRVSSLHAFNEKASRSNNKYSVQKVSSETLDSSTTCNANGVAPSDSALMTKLLRAADEHKDQTYFLYRISGRALARTLFPLGDYTKEQVRAMADERNLPAANKPDSQGICFIGEASIQDFLRQYVEPCPGSIVDIETKQVVGVHDGALFFTLGQRKGLGVGGGKPYYVVDKDMDSNIVFISHNAQAPQLQTSELWLDTCSWIAGKAPQAGKYLVRTRHTGSLVQANIQTQDNRQAFVRFLEEHERVAPGQSAVVYDGSVCLGGGIVHDAIRKSE